MKLAVTRGHPLGIEALHELLESFGGWLPGTALQHGHSPVCGERKRPRPGDDGINGDADGGLDILDREAALPVREIQDGMASLRQELQLAIGSAFTGYLVKPVKYDNLAAVGRRCVGAGRVESSGGGSPVATEPVELDRELLDQVRILGDQGFRNVLDGYIEQSAQRLADLAEALGSGDVKRAGSIAHQIVGESGLVGLRRVEALARSIELAARGQGTLLVDQLEPLRSAFARGNELLRGVRDAVPC